MPNRLKAATHIAIRAELSRIGKIPRAMGFSVPPGEKPASPAEVLQRLQALPAGASMRAVELALFTPRTGPAPRAEPLVRRTFRRYKLSDREKLMLEFARVVPRLDRRSKRGISLPSDPEIQPTLRRLRRLPDGAGLRAFRRVYAEVLAARGA